MLLFFFFQTTSPLNPPWAQTQISTPLDIQSLALGPMLHTPLPLCVGVGEECVLQGWGNSWQARGAARGGPWHAQALDARVAELGAQGRRRPSTPRSSTRARIVLHGCSGPPWGCVVGILWVRGLHVGGMGWALWWNKAVFFGGGPPRHQQEHRPQRPTESSDPTQHAKGRTGDRPGPRKGATTRRNVTQGGRSSTHPLQPLQPFSTRMLTWYIKEPLIYYFKSF